MLSSQESQINKFQKLVNVGCTEKYCIVHLQADILALRHAKDVQDLLFIRENPADSGYLPTIQQGKGKYITTHPRYQGEK